MTPIRFEHFQFCPQTLRLSRHGQAIELRPKTAELLRALVTQRDSVVAKRDLIRDIWHTEHVTDQSVFQAVSELRSKLAPLQAIKTFPNRGYQWVLPVEVARPGSPWLRAAAVTIGACVLTGGVALTTQPPPQVAHTTSVSEAPSTPTSISLPALVAFSEGAAALQANRPTEAVRLLELSVAERPEFIEAHLLLAEAYLLDGQAQEARQRVSQVIETAPMSPSADAYSLIAAMDLLSRTDQHLGQMNSALEWAARAADQANTNGYECTAADLHDRVLALADNPDVSGSALQASPVLSSEFARRMLSTAQRERARSESGVGSRGLAQLLSEPPPESSRPQHCSGFRQSPQSQHKLSPINQNGLSG